MASKLAKKTFIPLSSDDDDDEPIYQPFSMGKRLKVPNSSNGNRRSISLSPIPQSPAASPSPRLQRETSELERPPSAISSTSQLNESSTRRKIIPHLEYCTEEDCDICEILKSQKRSSKFFVSSGVVGNSSIYNANIHTLEKPKNGQMHSMSSVDPTRQKSHFAKKLAQLDATMRVIAVKVNQNVWEEKYAEAAELQHVLIWLRKVNNRLKKLIEQRSKFINKLDFKGAQKVKDDYETSLKEAVDISSIQSLLSPTEDGRTESYRAATMYRIEANDDNNIPATTTGIIEKSTALESPETVRTRCCGLCKSSAKSKKPHSKSSSKAEITQSIEINK